VPDRPGYTLRRDRGRGNRAAPRSPVRGHAGVFGRSEDVAWAFGGSRRVRRDKKKGQCGDGAHAGTALHCDRTQVAAVRSPGLER